MTNLSPEERLERDRQALRDKIRNRPIKTSNFEFEIYERVHCDIDCECKGTGYLERQREEQNHLLEMVMVDYTEICPRRRPRKTDTQQADIVPTKELPDRFHE